MWIYGGNIDSLPSFAYFSLVFLFHDYLTFFLFLSARSSFMNVSLPLPVLPPHSLSSSLLKAEARPGRADPLSSLLSLSLAVDGDSDSDPLWPSLVQMACFISFVLSLTKIPTTSTTPLAGSNAAQARLKSLWLYFPRPLCCLASPDLLLHQKGPTASVVSSSLKLHENACTAYA